MRRVVNSVNGAKIMADFYGHSNIFATHSLTHITLKHQEREGSGFPYREPLSSVVCTLPIKGRGVLLVSHKQNIFNQTILTH